jgi:hypothetical protein
MFLNDRDSGSDVLLELMCGDVFDPVGVIVQPERQVVQLLDIEWLALSRICVIC